MPQVQNVPVVTRSNGQTNFDLEAASRRFGIPIVRLGGRTIPDNVLRLIPNEIAAAEKIVAYEVVTGHQGRRVVRLAVADPTILEHDAPPVITALHTHDGYGIDIALAAERDIRDVIARYPETDFKTDRSRQPLVAPPLAISLSDEPPAPLVEFPSSLAMPPVASSIPAVDLQKRTIPRDVLKRIPEETARKYRAIIYDVSDLGRTIYLAAEQPESPAIKQFIEFVSNHGEYRIVVSSTSPASIDQALHGYQIPKSIIPPPEKQALPKKKQALKPIPQAKPAAKATPVVTAINLTTPDLRVPAATANLLIPASADVERDLITLVGQPITTITDLEQVVRTGFIPKIVAAILLLAARMEASDVHIQAEEKDVLIRYRIDGILRDTLRVPLNLLAPIVSRIKILSKMKIDEQRIPQDGRFDVLAGERTVDLRISTFPTVRGEKVVLRLLDKSIGLLKFEDLGLVSSRLERLRTQIARPYGVVLSTGPTGSGKTTTLYAVLQEIAQPEVNVVTLEDPVEYEVAGINQAQIKPKIGFGFAEGLRSILRQDPNIIMVGEIRDRETAGMVVHAALTGHLVLSTLHTNNAAGALPRLINMGVEPFLITSATNAVIAQRLVRKLCQKCRKPWKIPAEMVTELRQKLETGHLEELTSWADRELTAYQAIGCDACQDGYKGRIGIFEVLVMSDHIEELAIKKAAASELEMAAIEEGMVTLEQDGLLKVFDGLTTLDEVLRVTQAV